MSHLVLENICKQWGNKVVLDNVSFAAGQGEFIALLGPSGCGKTTLLRTVAGLEQADSGAIFIDQREMSSLPPSQRQLAMVFQNYALFPHLTVRENLLYGLKARGEDKQHFASRLEQVSQLMGLEALLERLPAQLSGGQQQRVALGRAIIARNKLCLMDEPLSNLDAKLRQSMRREIRALQRRLKLTMLYVTHDQTEAMTMADQIVLLQNGAIEQAGTPNELYNQPDSIFVAQFIGSPPMNIMPLTFNGQSHCLHHYPLVTDSLSAPLSLGVRAEAMTIVAPGKGKINATIVSHEYLGSDSLILCQPETQPNDQQNYHPNDQQNNQANNITVKMSGIRHFTEGCTVGINWLIGAQYLFFTETGQRCYALETEFAPVIKQFAG